MKRGAWLTILILAATAVAWAASKPATLRITDESIVAQIEFEKAGKIRVTAEPTAVKPGTYWTKALSLFKKDDKGRVWELLSNGNFGGYNCIEIAPEQDKVLLLGGDMALAVTGYAAVNKEKVHVLRITVSVAGRSGERFFPTAFLDGKAEPLPVVTLKDSAGETLASGRCTLMDNRVGCFEWPLNGFTGRYNVEVEAFLGPFECKMRKNLSPIR